MAKEKERMDKLLYGVAYYDEYMPCDRLDKDVEMMNAAGINTRPRSPSPWWMRTTARNMGMRAERKTGI